MRYVTKIAAVCTGGKGKGKVQLRTGHQDPEREKVYSSIIPSTSALDGVGGQRHASAVLPPGKRLYPLYWRLGGPQCRSGRVRKISPPTGIRSPDRPVRSESLYGLSYPGPQSGRTTVHKYTSNLAMVYARTSLYSLFTVTVLSPIIIVL